MAKMMRKVERLFREGKSFKFQVINKNREKLHDQTVAVWGCAALRAEARHTISSAVFSLFAPTTVKLCADMSTLCSRD